MTKHVATKKAESEDVHTAISAVEPYFAEPSNPPKRAKAKPVHKKNPKQSAKSKLTPPQGKKGGETPPLVAGASSPNQRVRSRRQAAVPKRDDRFDTLAGIPTEAEILEGVGNLSTADAALLNRLLKLLAEELGSYAAARAWMTVPSVEFGKTPIEVFHEGNGGALWELLRSQSSRGPIYA